MFTKYATYEVSEILEVKGTESKARTASLDRVSEFSDYKADDGYLYCRIRAISSRVNKNNDGWPSVELAGGQENWNKHASQKESGTGFTIEASKKDEYGFSTFVGKPIFVDHNNSNPDRARGVIVDAKLHVSDAKTAALDPYYSSKDVDPSHLPPTHVELLLEVDSKSFPRLAKAIVEGGKDSSKGIDGFSMGANIDFSRCSNCGNVASDPSEYCTHIKSKGAEHDFKTSDGRKVSRKSFENCVGVKFFEISAVFDPADETALTQEIIHENPSKEDSPKKGDTKSGSYLFARTSAVKESLSPAEMAYLAEGAGTIGTGLLASPLGDKVHQKIDEWKHQRNPDGLCHGPECRGHVPLNPNNGKCPGCGNKYKTPEPAGPNPEPQTLEASIKTADNPVPRSELTKSPVDVDTLREEKVCPVCGSDASGEKCEICGYEFPPKEMENPDLTKRMEDSGIAEKGISEEQDEEQIQPEDSPPPAGDGEGTSFLQARKPRPTAKVRSNMRWNPTEIVAHGDEPDEIVTSDQTQPVTSTYKTAQQLIDAAKRNRGDNMGNKVAADPADSSGRADKKVDVEGYGGVDQASNEQASKADAQIDVEGKGTTGVDGTAPDSTEDLSSASEDSDDSGFNKDKTTDGSGPTKTWHGQKRQQNPVTNEAFPDNGSKKSYNDAAYPTEDGGLSGGSASKGVKPSDPSGNAEERVSPLDHTTTPSNNSGPTKTWSGTDGNGVLRQQDPVTRPTGEFTSHVVSAMKQADLEVGLGIALASDKWNRFEELINLSPSELRATSSVTQRVAKTSQARTATSKTATKMPSFRRIASDEANLAPATSEDTLDSALFG